MSVLKMIINGITYKVIYKRILWMYACFFLLYLTITVCSYYLLPEGILRGKHPIINRLEFSPVLWISTLQIFGYNLISIFLIIGSNLIAQQSRISVKRYVPVGYLVFFVLTGMFAIYQGTWSFGVVTVSPPLFPRLLRIFDIVHTAGLLEFSAYLLAATTSFKFTLWFSDGRKIVASRSWREVRLVTSEKAFLALAFVLLFCGALVESFGIIQLAG